MAFDGPLDSVKDIKSDINGDLHYHNHKSDLNGDLHYQNHKHVVINTSLQGKPNYCIQSRF